MVLLAAGQCALFAGAPWLRLLDEQQAAYVDAMKRTVQYKLGCTEKILNSDFYRLAFGG